MAEARGDLVLFARWLERCRQERDSFFAADLSGEPGWSLLLDLFIVQGEGLAVTTSGACFGAGIPQTTGIRWLEKLDLAGLIERTPHAHDSRFIMIQLSAEGRRQMEKLLASMRERLPEALKPPAPVRHRRRLGEHLRGLRAILPKARSRG